MPLFDDTVQYILDKEGRDKITDIATDPGGLTKCGITLREYPQLGRDGIKNLTEQDAITIYRRDYWDWLKCDQLPAKVAVCIFDSAVNQGQPTAAKILQRAVGVHDDGAIGPATIEAATKNVSDLTCEKFTTYRILRYTEAPNFKENAHGWISRAMETFNRAIHLQP